MRRLISLLAAVSLVAGPLATAGGAMAKDHREGRGEQRNEQAQRGGPRGDQGGRWNGDRAPVFRGGEYRGQGRFERVEPRGDPRGDYRSEYRGEQRAEPRYDPRAYGPPPGAYSAAPRRGGYLGPGSGEVIQNPAGQRLRPPPRGYEWVRTPRGSALVSQSTGQVFDVVPY